MLFGKPDCISISSSLTPVADFKYKSRTPLRSDEKAIRVPSGDHTGFDSSAGSKVKREPVRRVRSMIQMSRFSVDEVVRPTATRFSSGDRAGFEYNAGSPIVSRRLP